jgi:hypothetical protein
VTALCRMWCCQPAPYWPAGPAAGTALWLPAWCTPHQQQACKQCEKQSVCVIGDSCSM